MRGHDVLMYQGYDEAHHQTCLPLHTCIEQSDLLIMNHYIDVNQFRVYLRSLDLTHPERMRPAWDTYFMLLAELAARRSNCMRRRVGAMLVKYHTIISTGYNGTPRNTVNCNEGGCSRCNSNIGAGEHLDLCLCLHAEENALLEAGRERAKGSTLYCNTCPCLGCAKKIVQAGVKEVVYATSYAMEEKSRMLFSEAGVLFRQQPMVTIRSLRALSWSEETPSNWLVNGKEEYESVSFQMNSLAATL
jgi:dCMP deaminase